MPERLIIVDENVPFVHEIFSRYGDVKTLPGRAIAREIVREADVLIVRSVTPVDSNLLEGSRVSFVGSATIGVDHIETEYLHQRGTTFAHAPGSNAESVVEYVISAVLALARRTGRRLADRTIGIVGCGNIGGRLAERLPELGLRIMVNDPPLARREQQHGTSHHFRPLEELLATCDIVTLHVPLVRHGIDRTIHLVDADRLRTMKPGSWLINTSRGSVVDNQALLEVLQESTSGPELAVLDVWEHEPIPSTELIHRVALATPHIAGYSFDGKLAGTMMIARALARHLDAAPPEGVVAVPLRAPLRPPDPRLPEVDWLGTVTRRMYDISADDERMRAIAKLDDSGLAAQFAALRRDYPVRRTFSAHWLPRWWIPPAQMSPVQYGLRMRISEQASHAAELDAARDHG